MATTFRFIVPGTENTAIFGIAPYVCRQDKNIGEDLFDYLYDYPVMASLPAQKKQMEAESRFEKITDDRRSVIFKSDAEGAVGARVATAEYNNRLKLYNKDYFRNTVTVYQRFFAATQADCDKPLIATMGIVLCVFVLIYDPVTHVAAAAHLDKDQNSEDIASIIPGVFPGNEPLDIYIIGGQATSRNMEEATRRNLQGQLKGLYECSTRHNRAMRVRMFEVLGRPHPNEVTFDTRNGGIIPMYNGVPPNPKGPLVNGQPPKSMAMGQPLDSACRSWPTGQYWADLDSSGLAVEANKLQEANPPNVQLANELTVMRCQWDGTRAGWPAFYAASNDRICRLNVEFAFEFAKVDPTALGNVHVELQSLLVKINKPMMLEQSLKSWVKWKDALLKLGPVEAAKLVNGLTKTRGEASLTWEIIQILNGMQGGPDRGLIIKRFNMMIPNWVDKKEFAVDWEGRH